MSFLLGVVYTNIYILIFEEVTIKTSLVVIALLSVQIIDVKMYDVWKSGTLRLLSIFSCICLFIYSFHYLFIYLYLYIYI